MQRVPHRGRARCPVAPPTPRLTARRSGYAAGTNLRNPGTDFVLTCDSTWAIGSDVTVTATYPYDINLLGWVVASGQLNTTMKERVE